MTTLVLDEPSTDTSTEASIDDTFDTQGALVSLVGEYVQAHPQRAHCLSDSDTFLVWIMQRAGYSQRLEEFFQQGKVQIHTRRTVFHEAMQAYRSNARTA